MPQSHVPHTPYPYSASISLRCDMHPQRRMRRSGKRERGWGEWGGGDVTGSFPVSVSSEGTCFLACIAAICWLGPLLCSTGTCPTAVARVRSARRTINKRSHTKKVLLSFSTVHRDTGTQGHRHCSERRARQVSFLLGWRLSPVVLIFATRHACQAIE